MSSTDKACFVCACSDQESPLVAVCFKGNEYWICARHIPVMIHDPARLEGKLPGAEGLRPADDLNA